jgi:hypothetical protein
MADLSLIPDADWREAERRAAVIRPLTELERRPRHLILAAAALGLAERQPPALHWRKWNTGSPSPWRSTITRIRTRAWTDKPR